MDKEQIKICKHLARAYHHVMKAQKIINANKWDDLFVYEITEPLSKALAGWVDDAPEGDLELEE